MRRSVGLAANAPVEEASLDEDRMDAEALYRAHAPFVAKFLYRLGARPQELEDLVQQIFLIAHDRGGFVSGRAQPTTWLASIAIRVLATHRRTVRRKKLNEAAGEIAPDEIPEDSVDAHRHAEARESLERVGRVLETLPEDQRLIFVLHEIEERPCAALAVELDLPIGTVHSRLFAARRAFIKAHERDLKSSATRSLRHPDEADEP